MKFRITSAACLVAVALSFVLLKYPWNVASAFAITVLAGIIVSYGVIAIGWGFFYPAVSKTVDGKVLLTFDDGPDANGTPQVLKILKKFDIKAVFFLIGEKAEKNPGLVKAILADGHWIGNHTYSHDLFFSMKTGSLVEREIVAGDDVLRAFHPPVSNLFRPPVGYLNPIIARKLRKLDKRVIAWSVRSFDTVFKDEKLLSRLLERTKNGDIVLLHDTLPSTVEILEQYIGLAKTRGINFVNAPEKSLPA